MRLIRPTPSLVVATAALSLVIGGGVGFAAGALPKNSVGSAQIKNSAVKGKDLKNNAISGDKVKDASLSGADVAANSLSGADVAANSLTGAQIDESTLSIPGKAGSILLTGFDFVQKSSDTTYNYASFGFDMYLTSGGTAVPAVLNLPAGATVTSADVYVIDNGPLAVGAVITRCTPSLYSAHDYEFMGTDGGVASPGVQTLRLTEDIVTDAQSQLVLNVILPGGADYRILGAKVNYTYNAQIGGARP